MDLMLLIFPLCLLRLASVDAVRFHLDQDQRKCLREEIHKDVLVSGEYEVQANGQRADLTVILCSMLQWSETKSAHVKIIFA